MNLLHRIRSCLTPTAALRSQPPASRDVASGDDPPCRGCGWFDSSHELHTGLRVSEHDGDEVAAAALPLVVWLEAQLADWQPESQGAAH